MSFSTWTSYQIRKYCGLCMSREYRERFPRHRLQRKPLAISACITASTSRPRRDTCRDRYPAVAGKMFPAFPVHAQPANLGIWLEVHCFKCMVPTSSWYKYTYVILVWFHPITVYRTVFWVFTFLVLNVTILHFTDITSNVLGMKRLVISGFKITQLWYGFPLKILLD